MPETASPASAALPPAILLMGPTASGKTACALALARSLPVWIATQYIARQLHPDAFTDVDPVGSLRKYHETFLPIRFEGTWLARLRSPGA